ncbi:MAG: phage head-tail connector protein [Bacteroides sp.]|nr:phage head-tail connector protein [Eubacterium sp.]MCM1418744.1 phage head-tail connector protein [Roseburia sp.]MCM1462812.1 phage head-tail connector protein [Bacteroides sp.]
MEDTAMELLKLRLPPDAEPDEDRLGALLLQAEHTILDIIGRESLPDRLVDVKAALALVYYNRGGTEGEISRTEGEASMRYLDGLPEEIALRLRNYPRKVGAVYATRVEQGKEN